MAINLTKTGPFFHPISCFTLTLPGSALLAEQWLSLFCLPFLKSGNFVLDPNSTAQLRLENVDKKSTHCPYMCVCTYVCSTMPHYLSHPDPDQGRESRASAVAAATRSLSLSLSLSAQLVVALCKRRRVLTSKSVCLSVRMYVISCRPYIQADPICPVKPH